MSKSIVLTAAVLSFYLAAASSAIANGPAKTSHSKPSNAKPSNAKPGNAKPSNSKPGNTGHPTPGHPEKSRIYVVPGGNPLPWQTVRYLRVSNQSEVTLTVSGQLTQDGPTYTWTVEPGVTTFLAIDGEKIAAAQVFLWARSGNRSWMSARDGLTLVSEPYQANNIGVFTYTFNP